MTPIVSTPRNAPVPDRAYYFVTPELEQFTRYLTRKAFRDKFDGAQPRPYNPALRPKDWFDTTDFKDAAVVVYLYFDAPTNSVKPMAMTPDEAANLNLPGAYVYPAYTSDPTTAVYKDDVTGAVKPLPNWNLCSLDDAKAISEEIDGGEPYEGTYDPISEFQIAWNMETRRNYLIPWRGGKQTAALLIKEKAKFGVGAPGNWNYSDPKKGPVWDEATPDLGLADKRQKVPMPVRALALREDGSHLEELATEIFSPGLVYRTDKQSPWNPNPKV